MTEGRGRGLDPHYLATRKTPLVIGGVLMHAKNDLPHIRHAACALGLFAGPSQGRQQNGDQQGYDGYNDQNFYKRETESVS